MKKVSCLLLAAGESTRMRGRNKLLLEFAGASLVRRTFQELKKVNLQELIVVTGHQHQEVEHELQDLDAHVLFNPHFHSGMHSSIRAGLNQLKPCDAFFVCLADQPYFDHQVLETLMRAALQAEAKIFAPTFEGKRGHPVLLSSSFIPEILESVDGDYGCAYLLKRHPKLVLEVPVDSSGILKDIDEPKDYEEAIHKSFNASDPVEDFFNRTVTLRQSNHPYVVATVIEVMGSASARTGSKAIFDPNGTNLIGWVGGGCAERFIGEQSVEALKEKRPRIVLADLDDEIFGLGVACGGKMRVFIDPIIPSETFTLPDATNFQNEIRILSGFYGWNVKRDHTIASPSTVEDLLLLMAETAAKQRGTTAKGLREVKKVPASFERNFKTPYKKEVTIVGRTRITEALARHFNLLSYSVRAIGPGLRAEDYPATVQCSCLEDSYDHIDFREGEVVIIASHTAQDPHMVEKAIKQNARHIAMVGSFKRSVEVLTHLNLVDQHVSSPLYVPAGLDMDSRNPDEIALSIIAEVIQQSRRAL